jgi:16S rRNA (cytosine967-C5)-methyltransferase
MALDAGKRRPLKDSRPKPRVAPPRDAGAEVKAPKRRTPPGGAGMTPGARLLAAIELLDDIAAQRAAADDIVGSYFRRHRFAGAKDRGAISEHIYSVLRHRAAIDWWLERSGCAINPKPARLRLFASVLIVEGWAYDVLLDACDGDRFRPLPINREERMVVEKLVGHTIEHPEMPDAVRYNYPAWLEAPLKSLFGRNLPSEMAALNGSAALDLRVNTLKATRQQVLAAFGAERIPVETTPYSPLGIRVRNRIPLATLELFKEGWVEVQDEASQIAALLANAQPGMRVVDFCAGAGGKTLALAASMANKGQLIACDTSEKRLERSGQRLRRAGISNVERRALTSERDKWVKRHTESFDLVFVDAPCTGIGTWRRNPDAKWRLTPKDLEELQVVQANILESACRLVKPGGRLVYATCSMLPAENDGRIEAFLGAHADFKLVPAAEAWAQAFETEYPAGGQGGETLKLSPARHGTDGFFAAVMTRVAAS